MSSLSPRQQWFVERLAAFRERAAAASGITEVRQLFEEAAGEWNLGWDAGVSAQRVLLKAAGGQCEALCVRPADADVGRTLVWLHGGAFVLGSSAAVALTIATLARGAGCEVLALDYPLAPEAPFPHALDMVVAATRHLLDEAQGRGAASRPLLIGGESAGAHLALMAAAELAPHPLLAGVLLSNGALDPGLHPDHAEVQRMWKSYLGAARSRTPARADPARAATAALPPVFIQAAGQDDFLEDSLSLARALACAGVDFTLRVQSRATHGFVALGDSCPVSRQALAEASDFIRSCRKEAGN